MRAAFGQPPGCLENWSPDRQFMASSPLTVAWISEYPIEWMPDCPEVFRGLPKQHPATWMPVLLEELRAVAGLSLHVMVLRNNIARSHSFERHGVNYHVLKIPRMTRASSLFLVDTLVLKRALGRIRPDVVHAWGTERGAALVASRLGYPYLVTIQGLLTWYQQIIPFTVYDSFVAKLEQVALRRARWATTEAVFSAQYLRERYPQLNVMQVEHAPQRSFHQVERRPQSKPLRFLTVGTLDYRKGSDLLFRALNQLLPQFPFEVVVVGGSGGVFIDRLRAELSPGLWERVRFRTGLSPAEVGQELAVATLKILPTRADTSPNAVKEAVVAGVPVVASRIGGIPDYVRPGENGLLFESGDLVSLVGAIQSALHHPLFGRGQVESTCLSKMRDYLSPERMNQRFLEAYEMVRRHWRDSK